jgi:outer membrane protein W
MKTIKIFLLFAVSALFVSSADAQRGDTKIEIGYSVSFPASSFKDFIGDASPRGIDLRIMHNITDKIAVGFGTGFQDFYQKYPRQVYKLSDGSDVSAVMTNSVQTIPLLARFQYNFTPTARVQPFVGAGVGGDMIMYHQYLGEFDQSKSGFAFQAQPTAGIYFPFRQGGRSGLSLSGYYNVIPYKYNGTTNLNSFGVSLSVSLPTKSY